MLAIMMKSVTQQAYRSSLSSIKTNINIQKYHTKTYSLTFNQWGEDQQDNTTGEYNTEG